MDSGTLIARIRQHKLEQAVAQASDRVRAIRFELATRGSYVRTNASLETQRLDAERVDLIRRLAALKESAAFLEKRVQAERDARAKSILMEIGGEDPTVDMRQGVEFWNYARRAGKDAVMLLYPGEGHGLGKKENAVDYERRILQWFAYHLKGEAPAKWITEGQSWVQRKAILDANK